MVQAWRQTEPKTMQATHEPEENVSQRYPLYGSELTEGLVGEARQKQHRDTNE